MAFGTLDRASLKLLDGLVRFEPGHLLEFATLANSDRFQEDLLDHNLAVPRALPPPLRIGIVAGLELMFDRRPAVSNFVISTRLAWSRTTPRGRFFLLGNISRLFPS